MSTAMGFADYLTSGTGNGDSYLLFGPVKPNSLFRVDTDPSIDPDTAAPDLRVRGNDWSYEVTINSPQELASLAKYYRVEGRSEVIFDTTSLGRPARSIGRILGGDESMNWFSSSMKGAITWCG